MKILIHTKKLTLTEEEQAYIEKKMEKISDLSKRIKDESSEIKVEIDRDDTKATEDSLSCAITIIIPKETLRAESHGTFVKEVVDIAKKKLIPQIEKYKEKFSHF